MTLAIRVKNARPWRPKNSKKPLMPTFVNPTVPVLLPVASPPFRPPPSSPPPLSPPQPSVAPAAPATVRRIVATVKKFCTTGETKWTPKEYYYSNRHVEINLNLGGKFTVHPNRTSKKKCKKVLAELLECGKFRQHRIQAQDEPRVHFLLHQRATEDFNGSDQPGYKYSRVTMKAHPLESCPKVERLAKTMAERFNIQDWSIGINPVLYRGASDGMGFHADDDQEEELIVCLVVASPPDQPRRVVIKPKGSKDTWLDGDEEIELFLQPGDVYSMDGEMQKHYVHGVPKENIVGEDTSENRRLVIVFRKGKEVWYKKTSGTVCKDLSPKPPKVRTFGNSIPEIEEGRTYSRPFLYNCSAHLGQQRGISGNLSDGCDAIIVSGNDGMGDFDTLLSLIYAAESKVGGGSMITSYKEKRPIRVFRSSKYQYRYKAPGVKKNKVVYRYDGLYNIVKYDDPELPKGAYHFYLERIDARRNPNNVRNEHYLQHCLQLGTIESPPVETLKTK